MEEGRNFIKELEEENIAKAKPKLYKNSSFKEKNKAIERIKEAEKPKEASESSEGDDDEESKDAVMETNDKIGDLPMPKSMFSKPPSKFTGKVKATTAMPPVMPTTMPTVSGKPSLKSRLARSYEPVAWSEVFDEREMLDDTIPVYHAGTTGPLLFCIHGAGHSALSFGPLARAVKDFARVVAFDLRGHGGHFIEDEGNMTISILIEE